jgi:rubrerythrin
MADKKMIRDLKAKIEALIIAIPRELEAYEYYMELVDEYEDPSSKDMFTFLAKQELAHRDALERLLNELEAKLERIISESE